MVSMPSIIRIRRGTEKEWNDANPVLMEGEMGLVTTGADTNKVKVGDGKSPWKQLTFTIGGKGDKGDKGAPGIDGKTPNIKIIVGITDGSNATVQKNGTNENPVFTFEFPKWLAEDLRVKLNDISYLLEHITQVMETKYGQSVREIPLMIEDGTYWDTEDGDYLIV